MRSTLANSLRVVHVLLSLFLTLLSYYALFFKSEKHSYIHELSTPLDYFDMPVSLDGAPRKPDTAPFTQQQKEDLERLWKIHTQHDTLDDGNVPNHRIEPINSDCIHYMTRLHGFFFSFLKKHTRVPSHCQDTNKEEDERDFLKDSLRESCLEPFYSRFIEKNDKRRANKAGILRLNGEKALIMLHHEDFLFELNQYEFRGRFRSDDNTCLMHCYGAYLYHHPLDALPALNAAMCLAVTSLWRLRYNVHLGSESTMRNKNEILRVNRFLDCCRINVRFVHVSPHLPMADIKTGLVKKFIAVKGHVVKARPKRLRVSTADL